MTLFAKRCALKMGILEHGRYIAFLSNFILALGLTMPSIIPILGFSEPFSSLSHLLAAGVFAILGGLLLYRGRGSRGRSGALGIFVFACVFLLSMSGVFHLLDPGGTPRAVLQRLDHAAIFILIAGTFTPIHGLLFKGWSRWGMLSVIWSLAIIGLTLKAIYFAEMPEGIGLLLYLGLGWLGTVSAFLLHRHHSGRFLKPLIYGALAYTIGALFDYLHLATLIPGIIGPHELFHVAVLFGIGFHWHMIDRITQTHVEQQSSLLSKY